MILNTKDFKREFDWVSKFADKKQSIPILTQVLISANNGSMMMVATDLEISAAASLRASQGPFTEGNNHNPDDPPADPSFTVCAPAKLVNNFLKTVTSSRVEVTVLEKNNLSIKGGSLAGTFQCMDASSYPEVPCLPTPSVTLSGMDKAVSRILISTATAVTRFTLNGALVTLSQDGSKMVATDGHRLSLVPIACVPDSPDFPPLRTLIHRHALAAAGKMNGGSFRFGCDDAWHTFMSGPRAIWSRRLSGTFPDYEKIIPTDPAHSATLSADAFLSALRSVDQCADQKSHSATFVFRRNEVVVEAHSLEAGRAEAKCQASFNGPPLDEGYAVGISAKYLIDFAAMAKGEITWKFTDQKSAQLFSADGGFTYVVMPMRI
jgi:DNA polymerase-3 subunit beta